MKCLVVAYDKNYAIGKGNDLPWGRKLKADLIRFKALTLGKTVVMGRKTYESIGFALPGRENIVVSRQRLNLPGSIIVVGSVDEAYAAASKEIYVIGGATLYEQTLSDVDVVYATEVDVTVDGADTFFPALDDELWRETSRTHRQADAENMYNFDFVTYERAF